MLFFFFVFPKVFPTLLDFSLRFIFLKKWMIIKLLVSSLSYLTYIKLCTLVKRNESMAHTLQAKLKEPEADENKRGPRPQDLIRLYDIILQVNIWFIVIFLIRRL